MKRDNVTLKTYFETGDYPTEAQFIDLIDSFLNIEEEDAVVGITDNGDGTYTFSLLSGGSITLNGADLPNDIPIANIAGLQAALDARDPGNFLSKDQDETTNGNISIVPDPATAQKFFSVARDAVSGPSIQTSAYVSLNDGASAIFGNSSSSDGQDSHIIIRRNGELEFNDNGSSHTVWHSGNDGLGSGLDTDLWNGKQRPTNFGNSLYNGNAYQSNLDLNTVLVVGESRFSQGNGANHPASSAGYIWTTAGGDTANRGVQWYVQNNNNGLVYFRCMNGKTWHRLAKAGELSVFVRNDGSAGTRFGGNYLQFNGDGASNNDYIAYNDSTNAFYFNADTTRQNTAANAKVYASEFYAGGTYYYGDDKRMFQFSDSWLRLNPSNHFTSGIYCASSILRTDNQLQVGSSGSKFLANSAGDVKISGAFLRSAHNTGYLEGSYNNIGVNSTKTNPIYVIGSNYVPGQETLGNMYGIGYSNSSASFLNSTDLGTNPAGWGLYIAADGNARIFLNASNGRGYFKDVIYASNFILNSDERLKEDVEDINVENLAVRWRKFKMKEDKNKGQRYGVIAQELEKRHPEFVRTDDEGNKSVAYIDLLVAKNSELEARLRKLEKLIETLI